MSTEHLPEEDAMSCSSGAAPRPWGKRQTMLAFGIAAVIAAAGGAVIYAATGRSSSQFMAPPGMHVPGPGGGQPDGASGSRGFLSQAGPAGHGVRDGAPLHGQVVVSDGAGGYVTVLSQTGVITAVRPDSVTVRSKDGFSQTWVLSAGQESAFAVGDIAMIRGEQAAGEPGPKVTQVLDPLSTPR
jgi:hypothetical protein